MKTLNYTMAISAVLIGNVPVSAGCYRTATYIKQSYVAPTYYPPAVASVLVYPIQLFSVGPGYAAPPPPVALVPAAPVLTQCDKNLAIFREEMKAVIGRLEQRNQLLELQLNQALGGQRPLQQAQQPQSVPKSSGDLSWLTGEKGCAACHGGKEPVKGLDYTKGIENLTPRQLVKTVKNVDEDTMPPKDPKAYAERGIQGPHPSPTKEQREALSAAIAALGKS